MRSLTFLATTVSALTLAGAANAAVSIVNVQGAPDPGLPAGSTLVANFNSVSDPTPPYLAPGFSYSGTTFNTGTSSGVAAAPFGDSTQYAYVLGGASATLTSPYDITRLSIYIGSVDDYNTLNFYGRNGALVGTLTGTDLMAPTTPTGDQGVSGSKRFTFAFSAPVASVVFASKDNSLEFDTIGVTAAPEPGTWALMIAGVGLAGVALRRRRTGLESLTAAA